MASGLYCDHGASVAIPREQTCIPLDPAAMSIAKINISKLLFAGMLVFAIKQ